MAGNLGVDEPPITTPQGLDELIAEIRRSSA